MLPQMKKKSAAILVESGLILVNHNVVLHIVGFAYTQQNHRHIVGVAPGIRKPSLWRATIATMSMHVCD